MTEQGDRRREVLIERKRRREDRKDGRALGRGRGRGRGAEVDGEVTVGRRKEVRREE